MDKAGTDRSNATTSKGWPWAASDASAVEGVLAPARSPRQSRVLSVVTAVPARPTRETDDRSEQQHGARQQAVPAHRSLRAWSGN